MRSTFAFTNPDNLECTLNTTMSMKDWKDLRDQLLTGNFLSGDLHDDITNMVNQAEKVFYPKPPKIDE